METGFGNDPQRRRHGTKSTVRRSKTVGYYGIVVLLSVQFVQLGSSRRCCKFHLDNYSCVKKLGLYSVLFGLQFSGLGGFVECVFEGCVLEPAVVEFSLVHIFPSSYFQTRIQASAMAERIQ